MQRERQRAGAIAGGWDDPYADDVRDGRASLTTYILAGLALAAAFAAAGHYMGQNAAARTAPQSQAEFADLISPATTSILGKSSLLTSTRSARLQKELEIATQEIIASGKSDFLIDDSLIENSPTEHRMLVNLPSDLQLGDGFDISREQKQKLIAQRKFRLAEADCLARAVYFEARSESEIGQLAVAKVVLNRLKDPTYPKTICGVVYQGSDRPNSCQFSFACDGISDQPKQRDAWVQSKRIAARALAGDQTIKILGAATYYHADYVTPKWSSSFKRLIKIGRHIFYSDS